MTLLTFAQTAPLLRAGYFVACQIDGAMSHHLFSLDGINIYSAELIQAFAREHGRAYDSERDTAARINIRLEDMMDERQMWQVFESVEWGLEFLPFRTTDTTPLRHLQTFLTQRLMRQVQTEPEEIAGTCEKTEEQCLPCEAKKRTRAKKNK